MADEVAASAAFPGFSLKGRKALVTGGGTHLGFAMANAVAAQGATVTVLARSEEFLKNAAERLGEGHDYIVADLTKEATYDLLRERGVHYDILVNNAGGDPADASWEDQSAQAWLDTYHLNVVASNELVRTFRAGMRERGWGRVVNIASVFGMVAPNPKNRKQGFDAGAYTASKHAVIGLTHFLAAKLGREGITVNSVSPGMYPLPSDDPYLERTPWRRRDQSWLDALGEQCPAGRVGVPSDLGGAVAFLASDAAAYVTGQNIAVDGGWVIW